MQDGTLAIEGDTAVVTFERRLDHAIDRVWAALTVPERLAEWIAPGEFEGRVGGRYTLRWAHGGPPTVGEITVFEPPHRLEYTWRAAEGPASRVRWELAAEGAGCRLVLTHRLPADQGADLLAAGWHSLLEVLPWVLEGRTTAWTFERFKALQTHYAERLGRSSPLPDFVPQDRPAA